MAKLLFMRILMVLAATAMLVDMAVAVDHTVGSPNGGWDLSTDLSSWASSQKFSVGDNLDFQFDSTHDVLEVTRENYDSCGLGSPISTTVTSPARFPLTSAGNRYFICGRGNHCSLGMRVRIDVSSTPSPPPPQSTPPPASTPPPQSTPPPASTPPSPQSTPPPAPTPSPTPQTTPPSPTPTPPQTTPPSSLTPPANDPSGSSPPPPITGETADPPSSAITLKITAGSILGFGLFVMMLLSL